MNEKRNKVFLLRLFLSSPFFFRSFEHMTTPLIFISWRMVSHFWSFERLLRVNESTDRRSSARTSDGERTHSNACAIFPESLVEAREAWQSPRSIHAARSIMGYRMPFSSSDSCNEGVCMQLCKE